MNTALSFLKSFASFSTDIVILAAITVLFIAIGIFYGKKHLISAMLAFYPAHLIVRSTQSFLTGFKSTIVLSNMTLTILFIVLYLLSAFAIYKHLSSEYSYSKVVKFIEILLISIAVTAETIVFYLGNPFFYKIYNFSTPILKLYGGSMMFVWLCVPMLILYIFKH